MRYCKDCNTGLVISREYFAGNMYSCEKCEVKYFFPVVWYFSEEGKGQRYGNPVMVCKEL